METASENDGYDSLQYHTVHFVLRPHVHKERVDTVNRVPMYYTAMAVQEDDCQVAVWHWQHAPKPQGWSQNGYSTKLRKFTEEFTLCCRVTCPFFGPGYYFWRTNHHSEADRVVQLTQRAWFALCGVAIRCHRQADDVNVMLGRSLAVTRLRDCSFDDAFWTFWQRLIKTFLKEELCPAISRQWRPSHGVWAISTLDGYTKKARKRSQWR